MDSLAVGVCAVAASLLSAVAAYGTSPHCLWPGLHESRLGRRWLAAVLAALALAAWVAWLGVGAGFCAMLAVWMLAAATLPFLAEWTMSRGSP